MAIRVNIPVWEYPLITGYRPRTTFWDDFSIADAFGPPAIRDTFNRAFREWRGNHEYLTEMVLVLNHKCWQWNERDEVKMVLYRDLYEKANDYALKHLKGDELDYYLQTVD